MAQGGDAASDGGGSGPPAAKSGGGFSLSFGGIKGRTKPKLAISQAEEAKQREAITGIGASGVITAGGAAPAAGPRTIPKQADSFVVGVGRRDATGGTRKPRFIPDRDDGTVGTVDDKFEVAPEAAPDTSISFGLNIQQKKERTADGGDVAAPAAEANGTAVNGRDWETKAFKEDVARLPDVADDAAYEAMPIEEFGAAMLRGMGWSEGQGVGRRKVGPAKPFQYVQRPHRLGLGAEPAKPEENTRRHIKPGQTREPKQDKVFIDAEGRQRHVMSLDDKLVDRKLLGVHPGKTMYLLAGRHEGLSCEVLALEPKAAGRSDKATVRLAPSGQTVTVRCSELGEKHEADAIHRDKEAEKREKKERKREKERQRESRQEDSDSGKRRRPDGDSAERDPASQKQRRREGQEREADGSPPPAAAASSKRGWLLPHIRVRIIDKDLARGRLYLKKATVVDVAQPTVCDVLVDDGRQRVNSVSQAQLESIVPKAPGARVIFVAGEHRGQRAKLLHRNVRAGAAAVQLLAEYEVVKVAFDDIAEYVGDAHEEE